MHIFQIEDSIVIMDLFCRGADDRVRNLSTCQATSLQLYPQNKQLQENTSTHHMHTDTTINKQIYTSFV
jgi:hypothetical protein